MIIIDDKDLPDFKRRSDLNFPNVFNGKMPLTKRELQCICYTSLGRSAKLVARYLKVSKRAVERHLDNVRRKLGVKNTLSLLKVVNSFSLNLFDSPLKSEIL